MRSVPSGAQAAAPGREQLDLTDPVFLLQHLFQSGPAPPPPFPDAGLDPTQDPMTC